MIKRYNQFVNGRVNEEFEQEFEQEFDEIDTNQQESDLASRDLEEEMSEFEEEQPEEEQPEEEGGDLYQSRLQEVANALGVQVENGKVMYNGKKIIFPSETEMYHVGGKKFKTAEEVINYLEGDSMENQEKMERVPSDLVENPEMELELQESKSYRNTRKFKRRK